MFRTDRIGSDLAQIRSDPKFIKSDPIRSETEPDLINSDPNPVRIRLDLIRSDLNYYSDRTDPKLIRIRSESVFLENKVKGTLVTSLKQRIKKNKKFSHLPVHFEVQVSKRLFLKNKEEKER